MSLSSSEQGLSCDRPPKDLQLVQKHLGHARPATTAIYADVLPEDSRGRSCFLSSVTALSIPSINFSVAGQPITMSRSSSRLDGTDVFLQGGWEAVDILLVVDNSGSMQPFQDALAVTWPDLLYQVILLQR